MDILGLKQKKQDNLDALRKMLDTADAEKRSLNDEETKEYDRLDKEVDQLNKDILKLEKDEERRKKLAQAEIEAKKAPLIKIGKTDESADVDPEKEFSKDNRGCGEFLNAIVRFKTEGRLDPRLKALWEKREQTMGQGAMGGYALPEQWDSTVRQIQAQEAIIRPRANVIPAGSPPDAKMTFPALDQTSAQNIYGGVVITHTGEGATMTETDAHLREVSLEPKEMSGYIIVTNKLLANWEACGAFVGRQLAAAMVGAEEIDFMTGDGINKALGYINSPAAIALIRAGGLASTTFTFADAYNMVARLLMRGGSPVWLASQTMIPQLAAMVDAGTHAVWLGGRDLNGAGQFAMPSTLLGYPIYFCDRLPANGTKGAISLVNLSYYLIKDGSGPFVASSEHVAFTSNKTYFKVAWNVDARSWLTEAIGLEGSTTNTVSPFVISQ